MRKFVVCITFWLATFYSNLYAQVVEIPLFLSESIELADSASLNYGSYHFTGQYFSFLNNNYKIGLIFILNQYNDQNIHAMGIADFYYPEYLNNMGGHLRFPKEAANEPCGEFDEMLKAFNEGDQIGPEIDFPFNNQPILAYSSIIPCPVHTISNSGIFKTGFTIENSGNIHYGWIKVFFYYDEYGMGAFVDKMYIETTPGVPILAGSAVSIDTPQFLSEEYSVSPYGIHLNWTPSLNAQACQVRGGPIGGNDPHNFIISTAPYNQLFINGNSLTEGQEYQWKVRCATGVNPYSGISTWSDYDYFNYTP